MTFSSLDRYGHVFQSKVLGLLLTDRNFLIATSDSLSDEYFDHVGRKWIIQKIQSYFNEYNTTPTMEVMGIELKKEDNDVLQSSIQEELKKAYLQSDTSDKDFIEKEFINFCKNQQVKKAIMTSVDLLQDEDYDTIRNLISKAVSSTKEKNIGHDFQKDIETRYRPDDRRPIKTPWEEINKLTQGGYGKGDLVIFAGGPGSGKSWNAVSVGLEAIKQGANVIYYTLELSEGYVGQRFDANLIDIPSENLKFYRKKIEEEVKKLPGKLIIKEYAPKRASLDDIENHLMQLKNQESFEPHLIIIDYIDLLKSRKSRNEKKDELDDIYTDTKGLAKELNIPIITPSQVNRSGANEKVVEADKIAGSYDKIMIGDVVISISRLRKDKVNNTARWHIIKNRYGQDGITFNCEFFANTGRTNILSLYEEDGDEESSSLDAFGFNSDDKKYLRDKFIELPM